MSKVAWCWGWGEDWLQRDMRTLIRWGHCSVSGLGWSHVIVDLLYWWWVLQKRSRGKNLGVSSEVGDKSKKYRRLEVWRVRQGREKKGTLTINLLRWATGVESYIVLSWGVVHNLLLYFRHSILNITLRHNLKGRTTWVFPREILFPSAEHLMVLAVKGKTALSRCATGKYLPVLSEVEHFRVPVKGRGSTASDVSDSNSLFL